MSLFFTLSLYLSMFANLPPLMECVLLRAPSQVPGIGQGEWVNVSTGE